MLQEETGNGGALITAGLHSTTKPQTRTDFLCFYYYYYGNILLCPRRLRFAIIFYVCVSGGQMIIS